MQDASLSFLKNLLLTPSPSGFERPVQDVVRGWARQYADEVRTDRHGNVIAVRHPAAGRGDHAPRAPHLMTGEERNKVPQFTDVWVDAGFKDRKDAEAAVTPGDPVTFAL